MSLDLSDLLVSYLNQLKISYAFGVPGGAIEPFYDALARSERKGGIRAVIARHETGAAFMADGHYRETGELGVCAATTGPGAINFLTGVASALENRIPMLIITGQTRLEKFGSGALQDSSCSGINTITLFKEVTKYSSLVSHPSQFENKLYEALSRALTPPFGPVHLSIPLDVFRSPVKDITPKFTIKRHSIENNQNDLQLLEECLTNSKKTVFVIGEECKEALPKILEVADYFNGDIVTTSHAKGLITNHPGFRGVLGLGGHLQAVECVADPDVDLILAIGTCLTEWTFADWSHVTAYKKFIHISEVRETFYRSPMATLQLQANINDLFTDLAGKFEGQRSKVEKEEGIFYEGVEFSSNEVHPAKLMTYLATHCPEETTFYVDSGNAMLWSLSYLNPLKSGKERFKSKSYQEGTYNFSSMGWAIGASVGASLGVKHRPIVCITGDGSALMSGQELTVAVQENLPVVFVVLNDSALGMVKHGQRLGRAESIGWEIPKVNFDELALAMGAKGIRISDHSDLSKIDEIFSKGYSGPVVLDVRVDPEAVPPIERRLVSLGTM